MSYLDDINSIFTDNEFATTITIDGNSVEAVYNNPHLDVEQDGQLVSYNNPQVLIRSSDATGISLEDSVAIGSDAYVVSDIHTTGWGLTNLYLRSA